MNFRACLAVLAFVASPVLAGDCEDGFRKTGNAFTGAEYRASVAVPGLGVASAIGQLKGIAIGKGMAVLDDNPGGGTLMVEQPSSVTHKPIPMAVTARDEGTATRVELVVRLRRGAFSSTSSMRGELCGMLAGLKPGAEGERAARLAQAAVRKPIEILATTLASQIEQEAEDNPTLVTARRKGQAYRIKGWAGRITGAKGGYHVLFDQEPGMLVLPGSKPPGFFSPTVVCQLAADQDAYAMTLNKGDRLVLTGTFAAYDDVYRTAALEDCRPG